MSMPGIEGTEIELRERLTEIVCATPRLMRVLRSPATSVSLTGLCFRVRFTSPCSIS